jgi:hypothetical protein
LLTTFIIGLIIATYSVSFLGWGRLIGKISQIDCQPFPFAISFGLAWCIFLGGILNLIGIAFPLALDIIIFIGLGYFITSGFRHFNLEKFSSLKEGLRSKNFIISFLPSALIIFALSLFVIYTLAAPKMFNFQDDMEKYLAHPIRMISTGTLMGSPFSALGSQTFGGQAFLQGFALAHWPIAYVNSIDSVFALILCLITVLAMALRFGLPFWLTPLVVLTPLFISPQYVNISSIYTTSALFLFLFLGPLTIHGDNPFSFLEWKNILRTGLICAALTVLKTNNALYISAYLLFLCAGIAILYSWKASVEWSVKVALSTMLFSSPWILLYRSNWSVLLYKIINNGNTVSNNNSFTYSINAVNLFSLKQLPYGFGCTFAHYTASMMIIGLCGLFLFFNGPKDKADNNIKRVFQIAACYVPIILYIFCIIIISPRLSGPFHELRYLCPIIIAAVPSAFIIAATEACNQIKIGKKAFSRYRLLPIALFLAVLLISFYSPFSARANQALRYGSVLSFQTLATSPKYMAYNEYALSAKAKAEIQAAQEKVPKGDALVAYTPMTFHLDFRRNRILDIDPGGFVSPWIDFPSGQGTKEGNDFFNKAGSNFILWQYRSYAVRPERLLKKRAAQPYVQEHLIATRSLQLEKMLNEMARTSEIVYDNGSVRVMKLSEPSR